MGSHHNDDAGTSPEMNQALRALLEDKANQMTERKLNTIAAGAVNEEPEYRRMIDGLLVTQMPKDPLAVRVSIGEPLDIDNGEYLTFRGEVNDVIALLERALVAMRDVRQTTGREVVTELLAEAERKAAEREARE